MERLSKIFNQIKLFDWTDAFYKFGFNDGDGQVETYTVARSLKKAGYTVSIGNKGIHNTVINSIKKNSTELLPLNDPKIRFGYDNPRKFLPETIITLLDEEFPLDNPVGRSGLSNKNNFTCPD